MKTLKIVTMIAIISQSLCLGASLIEGQLYNIDTLEKYQAEGDVVISSSMTGLLKIGSVDKKGIMTINLPNLEEMKIIEKSSQIK